MKFFLRCWLAAVLLLQSGLAAATFHTFQLEQAYSNSAGNIQFVVLREAQGLNGQHLLNGHVLTASQGGVTRTFTFPNNLPSNATSGRRFLVATAGFAALGLVTPDYVMPDGFLPTGGGFIDFASVDRWTFASLPTDGANALYRNGQVQGNVATNFAGATASVTAAAANPNYTALWWIPAESGWGINLTHQGNIIFGTLFTYDPAGAAMWLVMANGAVQSNGTTFTGELFRTTGPAFNANPFTPIGASNITSVGTMSVTFTGTNSATLTYTFNGAPVTKLIQRQVFGSRAANCVLGSGSRVAATNYQDLWWIPSESGWGINVTHQDNILFATLFTYDLDGTGMWLVLPEGRLQPDGSYLGVLFRTTGPVFNANPFTPLGSSNITNVGTMRLRFTNGENGTLTYTVNNAPVTKQIVRQVFAATVPFCS